MLEKQQTQDRKVFLDILRVAATCAVVILHTVSGIKDTTDMNLYPKEYRVFLAVMDLVTWSVPVFIMISGYLFLNPARSLTWKQMLQKYCRRILLALVVFGVPYACLEQIFLERTFRADMLGRAVLMVLQGKSWSHLWYLYLILFLYLMTPAIRWVLQRIPTAFVYVVMAAVFLGSAVFTYVNKYTNSYMLVCLPDSSIYLFYYLCGYLVAAEAAKKKRTFSLPGWCCPAGILILTLGMICQRMLTTRQIQMAYDYPFTVALSVLIFIWAAQRGWKLSDQAAAVWKQLGAISFAVYLIHPIFINICYKALHITPLDYPLFLSLPVFALSILLLAGGCAWLLGKIPVLRRYVL